MKNVIKSLAVVALFAAGVANAASWGDTWTTGTTSSKTIGQTAVTGTTVSNTHVELKAIAVDADAIGGYCGNNCGGDFSNVYGSMTYTKDRNETTNLNVLTALDGSSSGTYCERGFEIGGIDMGNKVAQSSSSMKTVAHDTSVTSITGKEVTNVGIYEDVRFGHDKLIGSAYTEVITDINVAKDVTTTSYDNSSTKTVSSYFN